MKPRADSSWLNAEATRADDPNQVPASMSDPALGHLEENLEEPTMRAGTDNLLSSATRPGTLDEPTFDRMNFTPGGMEPPAQSSIPEPMVGKLVVIAGNDNGNEYPMSGMPMTVGRALGNDIVLTDIAVSRKHMTVEFDGRQYRLVDLGSGNGTLINDRLETGTALLHHGDRLELGNTVFRFEHPATRDMLLDDATTVADDEDGFDEEASTVVGHSKPHSIAAPAAHSGPVARKAGRRRKPVTLPPTQAGDDSRVVPQPVSVNLSSSDPGLEPPGGPLGDSSPSIAPVELPPSELQLSDVHAQRSPELPGPPGGRLDSGLPTISTDNTGASNAISQPSVPFGLGGLAGFDSDPSRPDLRAASEVPSLKKSNRGLVIGLLAASVLVVGVTIAVILTRPGAGTKSADRAEPVAEKSGRTLPVTTWGTNETVLVASTGNKIPAATVDSGKTNKPEGDQPKDGTPNAGSPENGTPEAGKPEAGKPEAGKPEAGKPGAGADKPEAGKAVDEKPVKPTTNNKTTDKKKKKKSNNTKKKKKAPSSKAIATAARNSAKSQYRSKKFSNAAQTLRDAAKKASKKEASSLRSLAGKYESIGTQIGKGNSNQSKNPAAALTAYEKAYRTDRQVGGVHGKFLRDKLSVVAPKAATSFMAKKRYESAKLAADKADTYGSGKTNVVKRVRSGLEKQAKAFFKTALKQKSKQPAQAKKTLGRILKMVPKNSLTYNKALKQLSKIK